MGTNLALFRTKIKTSPNHPYCYTMNSHVCAGGEPLSYIQTLKNTPALAGILRREAPTLIGYISLLVDVSGLNGRTRRIRNAPVTKPVLYYKAVNRRARYESHIN